MAALHDDVHYAWRSWVASLKTRGSTTLVILTLALGIGATTAMFALVKGLLGVLPFPRPEQLVMLWEAKKGGPEDLRLSVADYEDFAAQSRSFTRLVVLSPEFHNLLSGDGAERVRAPRIGSEFFATLGVRMPQGREFAPEDSKFKLPVVLLSERLWSSRFGSRSSPIGQTVRVDGVDRKVVGIVPRGQEFPPTADMWLPFFPLQDCCLRTGHSLQVIGRLREGTSLTQAAAEVKGIAARLAQQLPDTNANTTAWIQPLREQLIGDVKPAMWILGAATSSLLLMACVSVASILFARGAYRGAEIAMRKVLGAPRSRIVSQLLFESMLSAFAASILGTFIARLILRLFLRVAPGRLPQLQTLSIDLSAVLFAVAVALLTALIFGLVPALHATRGSLMPSIRGASISRALGGSHRARSGLIILENTVAFILLATSILLLNSLVRLTDVKPGFDPKGVLSANLNLSAERYSSTPQVVSFYTTLVEHLQSLPGVEAAAVVDALPMTGSSEGKPYCIVGAAPKPPGEEAIARVSTASPGYFKTMGIPLLHGRDFAAADRRQHVVVINEAMARANWPDANPIGKRVGIVGNDALSWEVVGLVADIKDDGLGVPVPPRLYFNEQEFGEKEMTVVVRGSKDPGSLASALRREVSALDPELPVYDVKTVQELVDNSLARNRTVVYVVGGFSAIALLLAAVGLYGVMLSNLVRRTKEFGVRIAIGSSFQQLAWLIFREGLLLVSIGMAAGLIISFSSSRILRSFLFGIGETDVPSYLAAALALLLVVIVGCVVLLRRITRLDPVTALKYQ